MLSGLWYLLEKRASIEVVYFTCTRSVLGSFKDLILLLLAGRSKLRIVNHLHGADFAQFYKNSGLLKPILKKAYRFVETSIVLTESMVAEFDSFPSMQKKVVPNFYPKDFDKEIVKGKSVEVVFFSNLIKSKGVLDFLEACKLVHIERPEIQFKIAGEFMSDDYCSKEQIENLTYSFIEQNKQVNLNFVGKLDPADRFDFLVDSSIFVLPTYYKSEAFPLTIIEAMRCGNVIIATKHNYLPDVVKSENGMLVNPNSPKEIKEAIFKYIDDKLLMKKTQDYNMQEAIERYSEVCHLKEVKRVIGV